MSEETKKDEFKIEDWIKKFARLTFNIEQSSDDEKKRLNHKRELILHENHLVKHSGIFRQLYDDNIEVEYRKIILSEHK